MHNIIKDREKLDLAKSFDELSKLLFKKIDIFQAEIYIHSILQNAVKKVFPDVFESNEKIEISPQTVKVLLSKVKDFTLTNGKQYIKEHLKNFYLLN